MGDDDSPYLSPTEDLLADTEKIYHAGAVLLPTLADLYGDLRSTIPGADAEYPFRRVGGVGLGENGPYADVRALMDRLDDCLGQAHAAIVRAGEAACYVARTFAETDRQTGEAFEGIAARIDQRAAARAEELAGNQLDNEIDVIQPDDIEDPDELSDLEGER